MSLELTWTEIGLRLLLTVFAGAVIGLDRGDHGRAAGLRTTILVCVAASVSMIQANLLLPTGGKTPDSFIVLDLMRLPLGILSGMGFIGAGAILRRGKMITGVTTAATLWFVTVMGLCFGGGQLLLGLAMLAIGVFVLSLLRWAEAAMNQDHRATLVLTTDDEGMTERSLRQLLAAGQLRVIGCAVTFRRARQTHTLRCTVQWRARRDDSRTPEIIGQLWRRPGVESLQWRP